MIKASITCGKMNDTCIHCGNMAACSHQLGDLIIQYWAKANMRTSITACWLPTTVSPYNLSAFRGILCTCCRNIFHDLCANSFVPFSMPRIAGSKYLLFVISCNLWMVKSQFRCEHKIVRQTTKGSRLLPFEKCWPCNVDFWKNIYSNLSWFYFNFSKMIFYLFIPFYKLFGRRVSVFSSTSFHNWRWRIYRITATRQKAKTFCNIIGCSLFAFCPLNHLILHACERFQVNVVVSICGDSVSFTVSFLG